MSARAILVRELGPPARHRIEPVDVPAPGSGEARVAIAAAGMNFPDLLMLEGRYQYRPELPFIPGMEAAGTVIGTGPDASRFHPGDRVIVRMRNGAFAEQVNLREEQLLPLPAGMSFAEGATFSVAAITAIHALADRGRLRKGETLLVLGAAGGVGLAAVEFGARLGAQVIAACAGPEKASIARARGAHHVVDHAREDLRERVLELTGGRGADVIYDPVGGSGFDASMRCIGWGGRLLVIGFATGTIPRL
ncbi:MAG: NADPH:quinone oxidoreductase family protein, partial [Alphaproteobacteria bacterium]|nr:NADPH:quinone oxidoreductase family protein [Alphaproteobacteria bacterium]